MLTLGEILILLVTIAAITSLILVQVAYGKAAEKQEQSQSLDPEADTEQPTESNAPIERGDS